MTINLHCKCSSFCAETKDFRKESRSFDSIWIKCKKCKTTIETKKEHFFLFHKHSPFRKSKSITLNDIKRIFYADYANHVKRRNEKLCDEASIGYRIRSRKNT